MNSLILAASTAVNTKIAVVLGLIIFIVLFFKLIMGFIKFCFRHPVIFIVLLLCGGLGFLFNFLLAGILILAVVGGGIVLMVLNGFDD
ncbi:hypothetical protein [Pediococcus cellicola]|uniref:Uncharacterized protein n=1 Tax=Pediococcus cellicola TaxID=319652 RepID=A0A0R2IR45_9LACO|nr:hypothetical protein [Pediococcus cellicola]KRN67657.1 hypothetical protein IV80_GL000200 [Pediococcus cellicola]GEL14353.1 hypothetical protein PCE01_01550 [Pediococcus cellicola]